MRGGFLGWNAPEDTWRRLFILNISTLPARGKIGNNDYKIAVPCRAFRTRQRDDRLPSEACEPEWESARGRMIHTDICEQTPRQQLSKSTKATGASLVTVSRHSSNSRKKWCEIPRHIPGLPSGPQSVSQSSSGMRAISFSGPFFLTHLFSPP